MARNVGLFKKEEKSNKQLLKCLLRHVKSHCCCDVKHMANTHTHRLTHLSEILEHLLENNIKKSVIRSKDYYLGYLVKAIVSANVPYIY